MLTTLPEHFRPSMLTYYCGNTFEGKYNDDSGRAYEIIFNEDKTVKTLYVGQFANGTFNDSTGKAWDISFSVEDNVYVYNKGTFMNGRTAEGKHKIVSVAEIENIISGYDFGIELKWE